MKSGLQDNDIEMYLTHNEGKSVIVERFITERLHIDKLDDIVDKYNNTYHSTNKTKPVDVKSNKYIDFNVEKK